VSAFFVTEFGHKIDFIPGYYESNKTFAESTIGKPYDKLRAPEKSGTETEKWFAAKFIKDLVWFSKIMFFLDRWDLMSLRKNSGRSRSLDINGGTGAVAALLKAAGFVEHATVQEMADYSSVIEPDAFDALLDFLRKGIADDQNKDVLAADGRKLLQKFKYAFDLFPTQHPMTGIFNHFPARAQVDRYLKNGFYETRGAYDLITGVAAFDALNIDRALGKVRDLLTDDGLFVCLDEYWWWPINSSAIIGHFPYVMQRLSYPDLERYIAEHHPAFVPGLKDRYDYLYEGTPAPTLNDWFALAAKNGLRTVAVERIMPIHHHRLGQCPPKLLQQPWFNPDEILRDIKYRKPDVVLPDLLTSSFLIAMTKA
jgi:hypothetical protein